jgi:hypothetical protein
VIFQSQCAYCRHYHKGDTFSGTCDAFPERIPDEVLWGARFDHRLAYPGDHGVRFEPTGDEADELHRDMFRPVEGPNPPEPDPGTLDESDVMVARLPERVPILRQEEGYSVYAVGWCRDDLAIEVMAPDGTRAFGPFSFRRIDRVIPFQSFTHLDLDLVRALRKQRPPTHPTTARPDLKEGAS